MASGIYSALSGAIANQRKVQVLSHNVANVNTTGFQGFKLAFEEATGSVDNKELRYAKAQPTVVDTTQGPIVATENPLDVSLGDGVFMGVRNGDGEQGFVRSSTMVPMSDGRLLTTDGYQVMGQEEPIVLPPDVVEITIGPKGTVYADGDDVGKIKLVEFEDQQALQTVGGKLMVDPGGAGEKVTQQAQPVMTGYLEMANVNAVKSMTDLISAHQNYNVTLRVIDTFSAMEKKAANNIAG